MSKTITVLLKYLKRFWSKIIYQTLTLTSVTNGVSTIFSYAHLTLTHLQVYKRSSSITFSKFIPSDNIKVSVKQYDHITVQNDYFNVTETVVDLKWINPLVEYKYKTHYTI